MDIAVVEEIWLFMGVHFRKCIICGGVVDAGVGVVCDALLDFFELDHVFVEFLVGALQGLQVQARSQSHLIVGVGGVDDAVGVGLAVRDGGGRERRDWQVHPLLVGDSCEGIVLVVRVLIVELCRVLVAADDPFGVFPHRLSLVWLSVDLMLPVGVRVLVVVGHEDRIEILIASRLRGIVQRTVDELDVLRALLLPEVLQLGSIRLHFLCAELPSPIDAWSLKPIDHILWFRTFLGDVVLSSEFLADLGRPVVETGPTCFSNSAYKRVPDL